MPLIKTQRWHAMISTHSTTAPTLKPTTEIPLEESRNLDTLSTENLLKVFNAQDKKVTLAVKAVLPHIRSCRQAILDTCKNGGKIYFTGAGTSLRLANLSARHTPDTVKVVYCGGEKAITDAVENAEDNEEQAVADLTAKGITAKDMVIGIAASGNTPYVRRALEWAREKECKTGHISCSTPNKIQPFSDYPVEPVTEGEVISGSTRLKAGSAQLIVLFMLTGLVPESEFPQYLQACYQVPLSIEDRLQSIALLVEKASLILKNGGRLIYAGDEYSGLLGTLDASECPPTFGTSPKDVRYLLAGGKSALTREQDQQVLKDTQQAKVDAQGLHITAKDMVIGISSDTLSLWLQTALAEARSNNAYTTCLSCMHKSPSNIEADFTLNIPPVTEATKLHHACTSLTQKMILNMISSGAMILNNKVYDNRMVDVVATNQKLVKRQVAIVADLAGTPHEKAKLTLRQCNHVLGRPHKHCKVAIIMLKKGVTPEVAQEKLDRVDGRLRSVLESDSSGTITTSC